MADKDQAKEQQYVVTANFLGTLTRGDIRTADGLPGDAEDLLRDGSIRRAKAAETKDGATWINEPDQDFDARSEAWAAETARIEKEAKAQGVPLTPVLTEAAPAPAPSPAPARGATKSTEG
jgi:hypothetical protein